MDIFPNRLPCLRMGNTWWQPTRKLTNDVQTVSKLLNSMAKMFGIVHQLDIWGHVYMLLFWYKRSSSEQIDLSSHGKHMMAPYQEVDSWLTYVCGLYIYFTGNSIKCYSFCLIFSIFTQNWKVMVPFTEQSNLGLLTIRMSNKLVKFYMLLYLVERCIKIHSMSWGVSIYWQINYEIKSYILLQILAIFIKPYYINFYLHV